MHFGGSDQMIVSLPDSTMMSDVVRAGGRARAATRMTAFKDAMKSFVYETSCGNDAVIRVDNDVIRVSGVVRD
jgi:hypothetical protein